MFNAQIKSSDVAQTGIFMVMAAYILPADRETTTITVDDGQIYNVIPAPKVPEGSRIVYCVPQVSSD